MRTAAAFFVCAGAALLAILLASSSPHAQPVTSGQGLSRVVHDTSMVGSGTTAIPLGLRRNCATNEILKWNGSTWACAADGVGTIENLLVGDVQSNANLPAGLNHNVTPTNWATKTRHYLGGDATSNSTITGFGELPLNTIRFIELGDRNSKGSLTLVSYEDADATSSLGANRIVMHDNAPVRVDPGGTVALIYIGGGPLHGWRVLWASSTVDARHGVKHARFYDWISPTLPAGLTHNWAPTGALTSTRWRITSDIAGSTLTGITSNPTGPPGYGNGELRVFENVGPGVLTLANVGAGSFGYNSFYNPSGVAITLPVNGTATYIHDATLDGWRLHSTSNPAGGTGDITGVTVTSPACSAGSFVATLTGGAATGDAPVGGTCVAEVGDISNVGGTANGGLTGGGASGAVTLGLLTTCGDGQVLAWTAGTTSWGCASAGGESTIAGAGLTLTGTTVNLIGSSDFSVGADLLDLSTAVTAPGSLDVTTDLTIGGGQVHFTGLEMNFGYNTNATTSGYLNYAGYLHGVTQFRDLTIADGKNATVATFTGSTKAFNNAGAVDFDSTLNVDGATTLQGSTTVKEFRGTIISPSVTGTHTAWAPTGIATATVIDMQPTGGIDLVGMTTGVAGRIVTIRNANSVGYNATIYDEGGTAAAADRFDLGGDTHWTLKAGDSMSFVYTGSRWTSFAHVGRQLPGLWLTGDLAMGGASITGAANITNTGTLTAGDNSSDTHTMNGGVTITNGLTVQSSGVLIQSGLTVQGVTTTSSTVNDGGTAPSTFTCGTSPSAAGGAHAFTVTAGTGTATTCAVTFSTAFAATPICVISSQMAARGDLYISAISNTSITIANVGGANMATGKINVICVGDA